MFAESGISDPYNSSPALAPKTITVPRLAPLDDAATRRLSRVTSANLRFASEVVRERATEYTRLARAQGAAHSMRLWRVAYEQALTSLARQATGTPSAHPCVALFWEHVNGEYHVAATFAEGVAPTYH